MNEQIISRLREGKSPCEIERELHVCRKRVSRIADQYGIPRRRTHVSAAERERVRRLREEDGFTISRIADIVGRPRATVGDVVRKQFVHFENGGSQFQPRKLSRVRRCPRHGKVSVWPCVACAASPI